MCPPNPEGTLSPEPGEPEQGVQGPVQGARGEDRERNDLADDHGVRAVQQSDHLTVVPVVGVAPEARVAVGVPFVGVGAERALASDRVDRI